MEQPMLEQPMLAAQDVAQPRRTSDQEDDDGSSFTVPRRSLQVDVYGRVDYMDLEEELRADAPFHNIVYTVITLLPLLELILLGGKCTPRDLGHPEEAVSRVPGAVPPHPSRAMLSVRCPVERLERAGRTCQTIAWSRCRGLEVDGDPNQRVPRARGFQCGGGGVCPPRPPP